MSQNPFPRRFLAFPLSRNMIDVPSEPGHQCKYCHFRTGLARRRRGGGGEGREGRRTKKKIITDVLPRCRIPTIYPTYLVGTPKVLMLQTEGLSRFFLAYSKAACLEAHTHYRIVLAYLCGFCPTTTTTTTNERTNDESGFPMWSVLGFTYYTQPVKLCVNYQQQQSRIAPPLPPPFPGGTDPQRTLLVRQQMMHVLYKKCQKDV